MKVILLDTHTGERKTSEAGRIIAHQWADGNWSCDCNREAYFDIDSDSRTCIGCERFLIVEAEHEPIDDVEKGLEYSLLELNCDYPEELLKKNGINVPS